MKKIFALALFLCLAVTAEASPVIVGYVSTPSGGGPYNLTLNGASILGSCISGANYVYPQETWNATETAVYYYDPSQANLPVVEAAWLVTKFASDPGNIQKALWDLGAQAASGSTTAASDSNPSVETWLTKAETSTNYKTITAASEFYLLTPTTVNNVMVINPGTGRTQGSDGIPQSFLIQAPEPAAFFMLLGGIGLIGMGRIARRKRGK